MKIKQTDRNEIKQMHLDRLQEKYNKLYIEHRELQNNYNKLLHYAIDVVFTDFNDNVELLARHLARIGAIQVEGDYYINPNKEDIDAMNENEKRKVEKDV